jgi:hypothetical protein
MRKQYHSATWVKTTYENSLTKRHFNGEYQWQPNKKNPDIAQSLDRGTRQFLSTRSQTFKLTYKKKR